MVSINFLKAYDMVPHSWVIESLNMMVIAKNVVYYFGKKMKSWRVELTSSFETLGEVPVKRDFSSEYAITIVVCNCPQTSDTHTENS